MHSFGSIVSGADCQDFYLSRRSMVICKCCVITSFPDTYLGGAAATPPAYTSCICGDNYWQEINAPGDFKLNYSHQTRRNNRLVDRPWIPEHKQLQHKWRERCVYTGYMDDIYGLLDDTGYHWNRCHLRNNKFIGFVRRREACWDSWNQ